MSHAELKATVERLERAGTTFEAVCVWADSGHPLPAGIDLENLPENGWTVIWVPCWLIDAPNAQDQAFVAEQMAACSADPPYARQLCDCAGEMQMDAAADDFARLYREDDRDE